MCKINQSTTKNNIAVSMVFGNLHCFTYCGKMNAFSCELQLLFQLYF